MNLIQRYQPARSWADEFDRFFDRSLFNQVAVPSRRESVHDSGEAWILRLDLPGFTKKDLTLTVTERNLRLVAETPEDRPFGGKVERQWKLGADVDAAAISAKLENGVLELVMPKRPEVVPQPKTIEIN